MTLGLIMMLAMGAGGRPVRSAPALARRPEAVLAKPPNDVGPGLVRYVTADSVYVNRGSADGLAVSSRITIFRGAKTIAACEVTQLAEHSATCRAPGVRFGDGVRVERASRPPPREAELPPSAEVLDERRNTVNSAPWSLVDFDSSAATLRADGSRLRVGLSHRAFADFGAERGSFQLEQVDAFVQQRLGAGLALTADASLLVWSRKPAGSRSPRTTVAQPIVRQVELSWEPSSVPVIVRVGRVRPRYAPGVGAIDGAQAGVRLQHSELGVYGGLLPDAVTTGLAIGQFTAGAYGMARHIDGLGATASVFQAEARAGWALRPNLGSRFEAGAALHGWVRRTLDVHGGAQFGLAPAQQSPASLDVATLDVALTPSDWLRVQVSGRYRGTDALEAVPVGVQLPTTRSLHAATGVAFDVNRAVSVAARGGLAWEISRTLFQSFFGPEITWRAWHGRFGLTAGYQEELGWLRGRTWSLAATVAPTSTFRARARGAWFQQATPALGADEVSVAISLEARLTSFLLGSVSGSGRLGLAGPAPREVSTRSAAQASVGLIVEL